MIMSNKLYDALNVISKVVLPSIGTLYAALAGIWGFPCAEEIVGTIAAVSTFLGAFLMVSADRYKNQQECENKIMNEDE